ncbi:MAG: hypothetical protein RL758_280 [Pseudomonadota bacterium]|jgi:hypothetical protein
MSRIKHIGLVHLMTFLWAVACSTTARATTLAQGMREFDVESLAWSLKIGLLGGFLSLILKLAMDRRPVLELAKESWRALIISATAGLLAHVVLAASGDMGWLTLTGSFYFAAVLLAGFAPVSFFDALKRLGSEVRNALISRISSEAKQ